MICLMQLPESCRYRHIFLFFLWFPVVFRWVDKYIIFPMPTAGKELVVPLWRWETKVQRSIWFSQCHAKICCTVCFSLTAILQITTLEDCGVIWRQRVAIIPCLPGFHHPLQTEAGIARVQLQRSRKCTQRLLYSPGKGGSNCSFSS